MPPAGGPANGHLTADENGLHESRDEKPVGYWREGRLDAVKRRHHCSRFRRGHRHGRDHCIVRSVGRGKKAGRIAETDGQDHGPRQGPWREAADQPMARCQGRTGVEARHRSQPSHRPGRARSGAWGTPITDLPDISGPATVWRQTAHVPGSPRAGKCGSGPPDHGHPAGEGTRRRRQNWPDHRRPPAPAVKKSSTRVPTTIAPATTTRPVPITLPQSGGRCRHRDRNGCRPTYRLRREVRRMVGRDVDDNQKIR